MQKKGRRKFIQTATLGATVLGTQYPLNSFSKSNIEINKPVVVSTWNFGMAANEAAWKILETGGRALDAVEAGVQVPESDPKETSVGYGGLPDREGKVTLDACIMDELGNCGSVAFLEHIKSPIAVARKVMEETPHVMLVGEGAFQFALSQGFKKENLLTPESEAAWKKWLKEAKYKPIVNIENHDTIGMLALDKNGDISGACTTSGMAYKIHGRVGDSPLIGAGLFVDNEIGGAVATGVGEEVIKIAGSAIVVENMRNGKSPEEACKIAVERIMSRHKNLKDIQVGFLALNKAGDYGAYSIYNGFNYAVKDPKTKILKDANHKMKY
ncbi:N(4)-(beta-N-acetylglucosaminyl)-L-asparaginase [Flexithrix dorotheae]|uniref:N(4)-(beta-N-acetylglucosaminyl)-L-asparaginase n=1 Tax=Flexithrix dorotheae TaxID=70993 RepID=UPI00037C43BC|nr:N(4)-(beta-N-acetylglucosaminyl)-L-asparaginase [Flexithrix dorotheae]